MTGHEAPFDEEGRCDTGDRIEAEFDWQLTEPSMAVVQTVAVALDREPHQLEPLAYSLDPDAVDALVGTDSGSLPAPAVQLSFDYAGVDVSVDANGTVTVCAPVK